MACSTEELHEMWVDAFMMLELETFEDDIFEWDMELVELLFEYMWTLEEEIESLKLRRTPFHANISEMTDTQWVLNFRFQRGDMQRLQQALQIPDLMRCPNWSFQRLQWRDDDGLCILL